MTLARLKDLRLQAGLHALVLAPASRRRCAKCGQLVEDNDTFCAFCRHPVDASR